MNKKYKRGDERNGKIFWSYEKECLNGERWITKEKFDSMVLENKRLARERYLKNKLKSKTIDKKYTRGDIKEDLVFWGYNYSYNNLEKWVSIEEFNRLKEKERIRYSERYNKNKENDIFRLVKNFRKV